MGDPVGIGPEIICMALSRPEVYAVARPLVIGDARVLEKARLIVGAKPLVATVNFPGAASFNPGCMDVLNISHLDPGGLVWGAPTADTGRAMETYILAAVDMAMKEDIAAMVTCPINKTALKLGGSRFHGHTEMIAHHTKSPDYAMMMAGDRLRVVLVTIHTALRQVPSALSIDGIMSIIEITDQSLKERFGIDRPRIAVAGLNPHAGEAGMFGDEEARLIAPAVGFSKKNGIDVSGPWPPDTVFVSAVNGHFDAVVCMYHDQGLIPFKLIHFADGVNTTLGLPIVRTSVDHGTAYDIAGKGIADPGSLVAAIRMAASQAVFRMRRRNRGA